MKSNKLRGTFLITLKDGEQLVFGNNYKAWWEHAREYIYRYCGDRATLREYGWQYRYVADVVVSVAYSNQPFYDDGGLKWCPLTSYQEVVDYVCRQQKLAPVKVSDIVFLDAPIYKTVLTKKLKEY